MNIRFWAGATGLVLGEVLLRLEVEAAGVFRTPLMWTAYIFFADGLLGRIQGHSPLSRALRDVAWTALASIAIWVVFEGYNLHLGGWRYEGLPEQVAVRLVGYAWSFATIGPALFITSELVRVVFSRRRARALPNASAVVRLPPSLVVISVALGVASCVAPLLFPAQQAAYMWAPVWAGFIFLVDPINAMRGRASIWVDLVIGDKRRLWSLLVAGALCGLLWEAWNYEAIGRWMYTFPFPVLRSLSFGEMPIVGFIGFPPFAVEYFVLTECLSELWRGDADLGAARATPITTNS